MSGDLADPAKWLERAALSTPGNAAALVHYGGAVNYEELAADIGRWKALLLRQGINSLLLSGVMSRSWWAALAGTAAIGADLLLEAQRLAPEDPRIAPERFDRLIHQDAFVTVFGAQTPGRHAAGQPRRATVTLRTSGTTGQPKEVEHTWWSLTAPLRNGAAIRSKRWVLTGPPALYAGLQVFLQCALTGGTLLVVPSDRSAADQVNFLESHPFDIISSTPSFWRRLFALGNIRRGSGPRPKQITLGGEAATENVLLALREAFPEARITQIYATSELGRCFAVHDGAVGFPSSYLLKVPNNEVELRVEDGELLVRPAPDRIATHMARPASEAIQADRAWVSTGDLVTITDSRVLFTGRRGDVINVAGRKIQAAHVKSVVLSVPEVIDAVVYAVPSALTGSIVGVDVVALSTSDTEELVTSIRAACSRSLPSHGIPRRIRRVDDLPTSPAGKTRGPEILA